MARTIDAIFQEIITEKINQATLKDKLLNEDGTSSLSTEQDLLDSLKTTSKVAIWKLWAYITSVVIWAHENLWDLFKVEIETIKESAFVASLLWWTEKCKVWQFGYSLTIDSDDYSVGYDTIDDTVQYIEHAAAIESGGKVILKVRRETSDILSAEELESFESYVFQLKFAGTRVIIWNFESDKLKLYYDVYYDPIVGLTTIQANVETIIDDYLDNIEFNSEVDITQLTDNIQTVEGVKAITFTSGEGRADYASTFTNIDNYYSSIAGYCSIDPLSPLSTTLNYIAKY